MRDDSADINIPDKLRLTRDWNRDIEILYQQFKNDFILAPVKYKGHSIIYNRNLVDGKEASFWHLITRGEVRGYTGTPDYDRAERLPWVRALIEHPESAGVRCFKHQEGSGVLRIYIWYEAGDFVVVLEPLSKGAMRLITAFYIQSEMRRQEMRRKYERRIRE
ncbi:MAG: hypothetical protein ABIK54_06640 [candidate division WOR-3 bacterium]